MRMLLSFASAFLFSVVTLAAQPNCGAKNLGGTELDYCYSQPAAPSDTLLVFFHGLGGNERQWYDSDIFRDVQKSLAAQGKEPWVLTISFGKFWLLTEVPNSAMLFTKVMDQFLPAMEKTLLPSGFQHRILMGMSMGGFNGSQVLLKRPQAFDKVALLCPAITSIGPQATQSEVSDYVHRTGAQAYRVHLMQTFTRREFPTAQDWEAHSPLTLAQKAAGLPDIYLSCGMKDEYGFQEGAQLLFNSVQTKAKSAVWVPIPNTGHCAIDETSVVEFLAR
jgi:pimeloyl-ACP methyl ester carboxylesterase